MNLWESVRIALGALHSNKLRTALTMLGVIIGVAAVIAMVAIGEGAAKRIHQQFASMGTNLIILMAGSEHRHWGSSPTTGPVTSLVPADAQAIAKFKDSVAAVAEVCHGSVDIKYGTKAYSINVVGCSPSYSEVAKRPVAVGRFINAQDNEGLARVAVIGRTTIENLTGNRYADMVGKNILVNRTNFKIIGILKQKGAGAFGQDQDDTLMIPVNTAMRRVLNRRYLNYIAISAKTPDDIELATEQIVTLMRYRHKLRPPFPDDDDFHIRTQSEIMQASGQASKTMTSLLGGIALVSLLVGGIGIMNIMLVSVTERTREIGIRKAVGATSADILTQFLVESLIITVLGGMLGIAVGVGSASLLANVLGWNVSFSASTVVLAVAVSGAIGLFFGIYPARQAAQLNPIDALRFE